MKNENIKTATLEEILAMRKNGETKPTHENATVAELPNYFWDRAEFVSK